MTNIYFWEDYIKDVPLYEDLIKNYPQIKEEVINYLKIYSQKEIFFTFKIYC